MLETIDNFFKWLKSATFVSDLIVRLIVVVIVGGLSIVGWFISIPIFVWYFYKKFGNARIQGCRCTNCNKMNDCNDKFCINCGKTLHGTYNQKAYSEADSNSCKCSNCNSENDCSDKFCINCGSSLSDTKKKQTYSSNDCRCIQCNTNNSCDDKFCTNCGSKLDNISPQIYNEILNSTDGVIVAILSKIAKIDGRISQEEASFLSHVFDLLSEKRDDKTQAKKIYKEISKQERDVLSNIDEFCDKLSHISIQKDFKIEIVKIFIELAYVDGVYDKKEENIIVKIVHNIGLDFSIYQNIKNDFDPQEKNEQTNNSTVNLTLDECYEVLESSKSDDMNTIKKNYRRLVKQYHYDSMASKDLPADVLKFAEEKAKTINGAYEKIKKSRS